MNLEVGMYVRTRNGLIFKIISGNLDNWDLDISFDILESFEENWLELYKYNDNGSFFDNKNIVKASHNIIDLIEAGDYVNGFSVIHKENDILKCGLLVQFKENEIKSIVTKEQFESIEYSLEG